MAKEGSTEAPIRHPVDFNHPDFLDPKKLDDEMRRVFDICHGCRRCFNLCDSFPKLFDMIDESKDEDVESLKGDPERLEELAMLEEDRILFEAADKDENEQLTKEEFLSFTHPEEDAEMIRPALERAKQAKDKNNDGKIDFQEFVGERGKDQSKDWLLGEKERFDEDLDKNQDVIQFVQHSAVRCFTFHWDTDHKQFQLLGQNLKLQKVFNYKCEKLLLSHQYSTNVLTDS